MGSGLTLHQQSSFVALISRSLCSWTNGAERFFSPDKHMLGVGEAFLILLAAGACAYVAPHYIADYVNRRNRREIEERLSAREQHSPSK